MVDRRATYPALLLSVGVVALPMPAAAQTASSSASTPQAQAAPADPTSAQAAPGSGQPAASGAPQADAGDREIADIVVTAQRRAERLQDVPIAVSVIGGGTLGAQSITSTRDLSTVVPGLVQNQKASAPVPYLRGIGTTVSVPGTEPPVVTYVDGLYLVAPALGNTDLSDVEQVEVLKGPQGTTFGRNAVAGVINVTTRMPSHTPEFQGSLGYSSYDTKELKAYGSTGLTDTLAAGLAVAWRDQGDGWGRNTYLNIPAFYSNSLTLRGKVTWDPSDKVNVLVGAFYQRQNNDLGSFTLAPGTVALSSGIRYTNPGFYDTINNNSVGFVSHGEGGFVKTTADLGFAQLSDQIGYQRLHANYFSEGDFTPDPRLLTSQDWIDEAWTNELLLSSKGNGRIVWLTGLFLLDQSTTNLNQQYGKAVTGGYARIDARQQTGSIAPFANVTWQFVPRAHLTLGARYTIEKRRLNDVDTINAAGVLTPVPSASLKYNQFTYRASLDYKAGPVLLYGSVNRGALAGVFQLPNPTLPPLSPSQLTDYEIGAKSELFDRRLVLNAAAFDYEYQNIVVTARNPDGTSRLQNGAKARVRGVDLDFTLRPVARLTLSGGAEFLDAKFTQFTAASVFVPAAAGGNTQITADVSGDQLLNAPKFSLVTSAAYTVPTPIGKVLLAANWSHKSSLFFVVNNNILQNPVDLVSANVTITLPSDHLSIGVFAKNIGNVKYDVDGTRTAQGTSHLPGEPRVVGVRLGASF